VIDNQRIVAGAAGSCYKLHQESTSDQTNPVMTTTTFFFSPVVMMQGTSFRCHSLPCKHYMQMTLIASCQESILEDTGAEKKQLSLTLIERDAFFFPYGKSQQP
jgi:hypothetical protein